MNKRRIQFAVLLPFLLLTAGLIVGAVLVWTGPTTQPEEKTSGAKIVRTMLVSPRNENVAVTAYGPVIPAEKVTIKPQVGGRIIRYHESLVPGGFIRKGEELIGIDPSDYQLDLAEQESALEQARFEQAVEEGRQVVAQREWQLLEGDLSNSEVNRSLVLREPHLRRTEAMMRAATNEIARARLALLRTSVAAPFNAMVLEEAVEEGQLVEPGDDIATLVGTDEFWVQVALPVSDLLHIRLPAPDAPGASARVYLDTGNGHPLSWPGTVVRLLSDLETTGRMARVLVRVKDPLALDSGAAKLPLLLGSYVRVEIDAGTLNDVLVVPRSALREGERIWVVDANNELQIRDVEILWTRQDSVLVANVIKPGERLIISGLKTALPGMKVDPQPDSPSSDQSTRTSETNVVASGNNTLN